MDSEDEFMSDPPSGDEMDFGEGTQDSEIGSIGGGAYINDRSRSPAMLTNEHRL
jgi:hypothetical protein